MKRGMSTEMIASEFQAWIENHPDRVQDALDALGALDEDARKKLAPKQQAAFVDLVNLLARATEND